MNKEQLLQLMIKHRRYFHQNPELGKVEYKTQAYIVEQMNRLNLDYQVVNTSTICELITKSNAPWIALRADIDALAINETNELEFKSCNANVMHACGHDGHSAILLGVLEYLIVNDIELNINIRFIFQSDEEGDGGAKDIIQAGFFNEVQAVYGLHLDNNYSVGTLAYKYNQMNAGGDELTITVNGKQAHGAYPHQGHDAIVCSSQIINNLQTLVSRSVNPLDSCVITIGTIHGYGTANTICNQVIMEATVRNLKQETRQEIIDKIRVNVALIAQTCACTVKIEHQPSYPPLLNDDKHVKFVLDNAQSLGFTIQDKKLPSMGLEDFSYYLQEVPGAFFNIGSCLANDYRNAHSSEFDFDEDALLVGALLQIENCRQFRSNNDL